MLVAVDPGVKCAGVAVFEDGELSSAWLSRGESWLTTAKTVWNDMERNYPLEILGGIALAVEVMQVYTQNKLKGDPNDLIDVTLMAGALAGIILCAVPTAPITTYRPRQWKGQVPKGVMTVRIQSKLSQDELARIELPHAKELQHNVWDATGIGLHHLRKERRAAS
jgi:hypothetical protein